MRLSVRKDDPGYNPRARRYQPYLDGERVLHCFTADEELGRVWCHKTAANGKYIVDRVKNEILTEMKCGKVEIREVR